MPPPTESGPTAGVIIFIQPGTTSQLAAGFAISIAFFILHVRLQAYVDDDEDQLQFASMLSITLTLFGGILLKTNTQDDGPYGLAALTGLLLFINVLILLLFLYQSYKTFGSPAEVRQAKLRRKILLKGAQAALLSCKPRVEVACDELGMSARQSAAIQAP